MSRTLNSNSKLSTNSYKSYDSQSFNPDQVNNSHSQLTSKQPVQWQYSISINEPRQQVSSSRESPNKNRQTINQSSRISHIQNSKINSSYVQPEYRESSFSRRDNLAQGPNYEYTQHIFSEPQYKKSQRQSTISYANKIISQPQYKTNQRKSTVTYGSQIISEPQYRTSQNQSTITYGNQIISVPQYNSRSKINQKSRINYSDKMISKPQYKSNQRTKISSVPIYINNNQNRYSREQIELISSNFDLDAGLGLTFQSYRPNNLDRGIQLLFQKYGLRKGYSNEKLEINAQGLQRILNDMYADFKIDLKATPKDVKDYMKRLQEYNCKCRDGQISKPQMKHAVDRSQVHKTEFKFLNDAFLRIIEKDASKQIDWYKARSYAHN